MQMQDADYLGKMNVTPRSCTRIYIWSIIFKNVIFWATERMLSTLASAANLTRLGTLVVCVKQEFNVSLFETIVIINLLWCVNCK